MKKRSLLISYIVVGLLLVCFLLTVYCSNVKASKAEIKTWVMPVVMREYLQMMITSFDQSYQAKIRQFSSDLKTSYKGFEDMPADVVFDAELGHFIRRSDMTVYREQKALEMEKVRNQLQPKVKKDNN